MIRVIQRRLIIPRGDTGTFTLPLLPGTELNIPFEHEDTLEIEPSNRYEWDVKIYKTPVYADGADTSDPKTIPTNGASIDSYYSAFSLPICEIREFA